MIIRYQEGMVLITSLVFLVVLTLLGVTAMRSAGLEENMAANLRNTLRAEQAAEMATRYGEEWLKTHLSTEADTVITGAACDLSSNHGFCSASTAVDPSNNQWTARSSEYGQDPNSGSNNIDLDFVTAKPSIEVDPRYLIRDGASVPVSSRCGSCENAAADAACRVAYDIYAEGESGKIVAQIHTKYEHCFTTYTNGTACNCSGTSKRSSWDLLN